MEIYFDNSATTKVLESVKDVVVKTMMEDYGNPSSLHRKGMQAEQYIKKAQEVIARTLKVSGSEILFTSGGSESNNMALMGTARARKRLGNHIISTNVEHAAVYNPLNALAEEGFQITYLPVDSKGHISIEELKAAIRPETILVSTMYVNNEVGSLEPVEEIAACVHAANPEIYYHVDAIQAYGKYRISPRKQGIDMLSVSGHKIHAPKGVGFLYLDQRVRIRPLILGGGQQRDLRSGTENVPGVAGLSQAASYAYENLEEKIDYLYDLKQYLMERIQEIPGTVCNSQAGRESAPQIVSISFEQVRSEVLLHALEEHEIYVSSGSACSSNHPALSGTLKAVGVRKELLDSTLRFSFSCFNTREEIDVCIGVLKEILPVLRRYQRG